MSFDSLFDKTPPQLLRRILPPLHKVEAQWKSRDGRPSGSESPAFAEHVRGIDSQVNDLPSKKAITGAAWLSAKQSLCTSQRPATCEGLPHLLVRVCPRSIVMSLEMWRFDTPGANPGPCHLVVAAAWDNSDSTQHICHGLRRRDGCSKHLSCVAGRGNRHALVLDEPWDRIVIPPARPPLHPTGRALRSSPKRRRLPPSPLPTQPHRPGLLELEPDQARARPRLPQR